MAEQNREDRAAREGELFRLLAENVRDYAIFTMDDRRRVQTWSAGAERLLGYREEEIVGRSADCFFTPEDVGRGLPERETRRALSAERSEDDRWQVRKDGSRFWSSGVTTPLWDEEGKLRGFAKIMRDRTEWKQLEEARRQSEASQAAVLETAIDGIITIDHEDHILEFNPAAERIFGYRGDEILGRKMGELLVPPRLRGDHYRGLARHLETGEGRILGKRLEMSAMRADGTEFPAELAIIRVPGAGPPRFTGYVRDITEHKTRERRRAVQLAVTEALAESPTVGDAAPRILEAIGGGLLWDVGVCWLVDPRDQVLRCLETWRGPEARADEFETLCRGRTFGPGSGLPGRVWSAGGPFWVTDLSRDKNFPRLTTAAKVGLRSAFAVPLLLGTQVLGVVEFLSRSARAPDADLLGIMAAVGGQIGQFLRRKQAEEALRESEQRFRGLMEQAPISIQLFSPDGRTLEVNRAWEELWGTSVEMIKDYNILADAQLEAKGALSSLRRAFAGEAAAIAAIEYNPNQTVPEVSRHRDPRRWVAAVAYPLKDSSGRVREVALIHTDITARKRAEDALRDSEERFRGIVNHSVAGVAESDLTGRFLFANQRYCEIVGRSLDELLQLKMQDISHPDDLQVNLPLLERLGREGTPYIIEKRYFRPDGSCVWVKNSVSGLRGRGGQVESVVAVCVDVTDHKRAENALRQSAAELAQVNEALREADRRKDEFLATLAHELRNPLAPIRTGLEVMKLAADDPATVEEVRDTMERQTRQLVALVDDLLDVSRITGGKLQLRKCRVQLADVLQSAVEAVVHSIDESGHELTVSLPDRPIFLDADPHRLAQVFSNLLNNAAKYTPDGGRIDLSAERGVRNAECVVEKDFEGSHSALRAPHSELVTVSVKDTGAGIPAEMRERIFEMFAQIDRSMERGYTGLGIGLTLVKSLVEMHHGAVTVHSAGPGQGSEFRVRLPILTDAEAEEPRRAPPEERSKPSKHRVLIVDDNQAAADLLGRVVKMLGNEVRAAHDGQQALEVAEEFRPDVVLMDLGMPKMDGYEAARRIRAQAWGRDMMLVALTGWGQDEDKRRTQEAGFDQHLVKPADPAELQRLLAEPR